MKEKKAKKVVDEKDNKGDVGKKAADKKKKD